MATVILTESAVLAKLAAIASGASKVLRRIHHSSSKRAPAPMPTRMLQHAGDTEACGTFIPASGGPTAIVIGARAPAQALRHLAATHHLEFDALALFAKGA